MQRFLIDYAISCGCDVEKPCKIFLPHTLQPWEGEGGCAGFQVTGMMEGFFGSDIFDSGIFLDRKIWQVFLWVA